MPAGTKNITIEQGSTFELSLRWALYDVDNPPTYEGDPIDLTDYNARMMIRKTYNRVPYYLFVDSDQEGGITLGGALGTILIHLTAEQTAALTKEDSVYDLELYRLVGDEEVVERLLQGTVTLSKEVTKPDPV